MKMTSSTETQELSRLSIRDGQVEFDQDQKKALFDVLRIRHATEPDMAVFFHQCRRTQLDPFLRQIYMIARQEWDPETQSKQWRQTFQTGIDGFRVVGHRRAKQLGVELSYEDTVYFDDQGNATDIWLDDEKPPRAVRVVVRLGNARFPMNARFADFAVMKDEYEPDSVDGNGKKVKGKKTGRRVPQGNWATMAPWMLEKCAEAGALRRACPQDLSGIYEFAEMERQMQDQPVTTLVDDGAATAQRKAPAKKKGQRNWVRELSRAKTPEAARKIWEECKAAGELNQAVRDKAAEVSRKFAQSNVHQSEAKPSDSGDSAQNDAPSTVHGEYPGPTDTSTLTADSDDPVVTSGIFTPDSDVSRETKPDEGDPWTRPGPQ